MEWNRASIQLLNTYRVSHNLSTPAAFTSPLRQALLTNPGIGRQSPTMARKRDQRRISKDQLALAVRKNFNGAAVSEIDVVVELVYKVRNQGETPQLWCVRDVFSSIQPSTIRIVFGTLLILRADKTFRMRSAPSTSRKQS